jgi:hypothetical protein
MAIAAGAVVTALTINVVKRVTERPVAPGTIRQP